jgi:hypothetical protein
MKNSTHKEMVFLGMGHGAWGMGKNIPMRAVRESGNPLIVLPPLCPIPQAALKQPHPPTRGWSFPPLSIKFLADVNAK